MPDATDQQIGTLIEQLKDTTTLMKNPEQPKFKLNKEQAEEFVIQKAGELVQESLDLVKELKAETGAAGDAEGIEALAKLVAATSSALEALNKLVVQDKKGKIAKEVKQMEVDSRKQIEDDKALKPGELVLKGTREDIFKQLVKEADIIEVQTTSEQLKETTE